MLEVDNIRYTHPDGGAVIRADFTLDAGGAAALMGPSGAGKSTLIHLIAGLLRPECGDVRFAGRSLLGMKPADRPLTCLLQSDNLFPHLSVWHNVAIGLQPGMRLSAAQRAAIDEALHWVDLRQHAARKPPSLSGGQQQRVALARCLARNRPLLLLDEPFSGLDDALRAEMRALILRLQQARALSVLLTTHQRHDAEALGAAVVAVGVG